MAYQKQTWREYDDTKTELQNINNGAVATPERLNHMEIGIANSADKAEVTAQLQQTADVFSNVPFINVISNGDFRNGVNDWIGIGANLTTLENVLISTASGTTVYPRVEQRTKTKWETDKKVFVRVKVKLRHLGCTSLRLLVNGTSGGSDNYVQIVNEPNVSELYTLQGIVSQTDQIGDIKITIQYRFADIDTVLNKEMEVSEVLLLDLTDTFGLGVEPSFSEVDTIIPQWFNNLYYVTDRSLYEKFKQENLKKANSNGVAISLLEEGNFVNVLTKGVVMNDQNSQEKNTTILKHLFKNEALPIYIPNGDVYFNDTLLLEEDRHVFGTKKTNLILTNPTVDAIEMKKHSKLNDIKIYLPDGHNQSGILLKATQTASSTSNVSVNDVDIIGGGFTSIGIKLIAINKNMKVFFNSFNNVNMFQMYHGIYMEDNQANDMGWVNGNDFNFIKIDQAVNGVTILGNCAGNTFNFQFQTVEQSDRAIYCKGSYNTFYGMVWDILNYKSTARTFELTTSSISNVINLPWINIREDRIIDDGNYNKIVSANGTIVNTPDETKRYIISVDNSGNVTSTLL